MFTFLCHLNKEKGKGKKEEKERRSCGLLATATATAAAAAAAADVSDRYRSWKNQIDFVFNHFPAHRESVRSHKDEVTVRAAT